MFKFLKKRIGEEGVLFDVGANIGEYTNTLLTYFPKCRVHSFEPSEKTFFMLKKNVKSEQAVLNHMGLSRFSGEQTLYYDKEGSGLASLYDRQLDCLGKGFHKSEQVSLTTLDEYCFHKQIDYIDFLKMDVEGNEWNVLCGAEKMLHEGKIRSIQLEFGGADIDARTYFRDFWNLLHQDYTVYRIVKNGLYEIKQYKETMEIFTVTNFFFYKNKKRGVFLHDRNEAERAAW